MTGIVESFIRGFQILNGAKPTAEQPQQASEGLMLPPTLFQEGRAVQTHGVAPNLPIALPPRVIGAGSKAVQSQTVESPATNEKVGILDNFLARRASGGVLGLSLGLLGAPKKEAVTVAPQVKATRETFDLTPPIYFNSTAAPTPPAATGTPSSRLH